MTTSARRLAAFAILAGVAATAGLEQQSGAAAMAAETLLETAPASLRSANFMLSKTFDRGVKDLDTYAYLTKLLLQHTLNLAERNAAEAIEYKRAALPMAYNLAANTWPGWGADGAATIEARHLRLGLQAAELGVTLANEVAPPQRRFASYWVLGAQLLAAERFAEAAAAFETCRGLARATDDQQRAAMAQGWVHLANTLDGRDEREALRKVEAELAESGGDGAFYAGQYATAYEVFGAP